MNFAFVRSRLTISLCLLCAVTGLNRQLSAQTNASVLSYGAVADGVMRTDGGMTPGSPVLTSASGSFGSADQGKYIQVIGAGPGGTALVDGTMAAGSAVLTSGSAQFSSSDVGRGIVVAGAGTGGSNLVAQIQSYTSANSVTLSVAAQTGVAGAYLNYGGMTLEATIQSVQSSTSVTLSTPAAALVSAAIYAYGTENHAAFQTAVDAVGMAGGGKVSVPAPSGCAGGAVCGYVIRASDQTTAQAPGAVKIRYSNVSLVGDVPQTNLFCRGAYGTYSNTVAFPGTTGNIRGFCLNIGDNGGPNGAGGEAVSNVTISNLHLYGMTNGNTFNVNFAYPPTSPTGDGWDVTHKAIYLWDNSAFANIVIDSVIIQDFKAENIYSGGSTVTGMIIRNSTITNFNGNGISMLAADLQVLNNTISNGSNAAVENSTVSMGSQALVRQLYQGNTVSLMPREGIVVVGVDNGVAAGSVQIVGNTFDTIAQTNPSGTETAIYIASQNNYIPPANVTITGNTCHDCQSFGLFQTSGNTLVQGNNFIVDRYNAGSVFGFTYTLNGVSISNNTGSYTAQAQANNLSLGAVYVMNPGYANGSFPWKNVVITGNSWTFPGAPQYEFVTTSGPGWNLLTIDNLRWEGDVCNGCTHADINHGVVNLSTTTTIRPYGPVVYVNGNTSAVTATVDASKEEDGAQVQIVNAGTNPVSFSSDGNLSLPSTYTLQGGTSLSLVYSAAAGRFTLTNAPALVSTAGGTPQATTVNTAFPTALQAAVTTSGNTPVSGVTVTFSAPSSGASATFNGAVSAAAVTGANGVATIPALTANGQTGTYTVVATVSGAPASAAFVLTNNPVAASSTGALTGSGTSSAAGVDLTAEGTSDWIQWGDASLNRKAGVSSQLSSYTVIGNGGVLPYNNDPRPVSWTDGTPATTGSNDTNGIYISGTGQGFAFTAPADTSLRTLTVHVGGWFSGGTLTAHLSDGSSPDFTDVTVLANGQYDRNYTLSYQAASAGQSLAVSWQMTSGWGNVTINAAALSGGTVAIAPPAPAVIPPSPAPSSAVGSLTGTGDSGMATANLTAEGVTDWVHWGDASLNRKGGVAPALSDYSIVGGGQILTYSNDPRPIMWTDGTPVSTSTNNTNGIYINFVGNGFSFTAPADTTVRTLTVHVGGWYSGGTLTAHLSDGSAADFVDSTAPANGSYDRNYTLIYNAATTGQTLTVSWVNTASGGNVTLNGAALR